jgi:acetoin utilization deacetylase AcuC-like enzyme
MPTAIVTNPRHALHDEHDHVEQAVRLEAIERAIDESGLRDDLVEIMPLPASAAQILAVHHPRVIEIVRAASARGGRWLDQDTSTTAGTLDAALLAAGAAVRAVEAVISGQVSNAFALVRLPGHHATRRSRWASPNIAVAARHATLALGVERVAIVDTTCTTQRHAGLLTTMDRCCFDLCIAARRAATPRGRPRHGRP